MPRLRKSVQAPEIVGYFQPLVSVDQRRVVGLEGLARVVDPSTGAVELPAALFAEAVARGRSLEVDRLCRAAILEGFRGIASRSDDLLLFLNFDASVLSPEVVGSGVLSEQVRAAGVLPGQVVLEVVESRVQDLRSLRRFVGAYRSEGFLIALDDVGAGDSNLNRIPALKPDVLKLDLSLTQGIRRNFYRQEVFKAVVQLSKRIGALIVAEGIETEEDAIYCLEQGADLIQGFHLARPHPPDEGVPRLDERIDRLAARLKRHNQKLVQRKKDYQRVHFELLTGTIAELAQVPANRFDAVVAALTEGRETVDAAYVLDADGIQVTDTMLQATVEVEPRKAFFKPAPPGADHSLKPYYYLLMGTELEVYRTEPYVSAATGRLSSTLSMLFRGLDDELYVLCLDLVPD